MYLSLWYDDKRARFHQLQARVKELEQENVQKSTELQRLRRDMMGAGMSGDENKGRVRVISPVPFMGPRLSPRDMNVMNNNFLPPSSPTHNTNRNSTSESDLRPMFHPPVPPSGPWVEEEEEEEGMETEEEKSEQDLFSESEALARRLMQEESEQFMRQLEQAQIQSAMQMDEETLQRMEEEDPDVAFALRLQREEHMERYQYEDAEEDEEEIDVDEMTYEEMLELGERIGDVKEERWRSRSQEFINKLPIVIFKKQSCCAEQTPQKGVGATLESCLVCQCPYEDGDTLRRLPCNHHYHVDCVDQWLQMKNTCPVCKRSISTP